MHVAMLGRTSVRIASRLRVLCSPSGFAHREITVRAALSKQLEREYEGPNQVLRDKRTRTPLERPHRSQNLIDLTIRISESTRSGRFTEALQIFLDTAEPDTILYNAALNACAKGALSSEARDIWSRMPPEMRTAVSYGSMIDLYGRLKMPDEAEHFFAELQAAGFPTTIVEYILCINAHSMAGNWERAIQIFKAIDKDLFVKSTVGSQRSAWSSVMGACARAGRYAETYQLFNDMVASEVRPEHMHFNALMTACARNADAKTAQGVFDVMPAWGLTPRTEDFNILISCTRQDLPACKEVFEKMQASGVRITSRTHQEMLAAYVGANDGEGARKFISEATKLDRGSSKVQRLIEEAERL